MAAKTLRQLATRLNEIIAENDSRGWSNRNDLPAAIEISRQTVTGRHKSSLVYTVSYVSSAQHRMRDGNEYCGVISTNESNILNDVQPAKFEGMVSEGGETFASYSGVQLD